jgi:hypothetical protein
VRAPLAAHRSPPSSTSPENAIDPLGLVTNLRFSGRLSVALPCS